MLRANIEYEKGIFGGIKKIIVDGPSGTKTFYGEESRDEADAYYRNEKRLEDEIALREKQSNLADMQMREIQERERRAQDERFRQKNTPPQFGFGGMPQRPPTPPTARPYYDPEYAEFQKWKKENDPEYIKFKQEKAKKEMLAQQRKWEEEVKRYELSATEKRAKEGIKIRKEKEIIELLRSGETGKQVVVGESSKLFCADRLEDAIFYYNQLIKFYPNKHQYIEMKALALQRLRKYEESITCYDQAIKLNPKNHFSYRSKAASLVCLTRYREAIVCYDQAIRIYPKFAEIANFWADKGNALYCLKRYDESIVCYDKAIKLDPRSETYKEYKKNALVMKNNR